MRLQFLTPGVLSDPQLDRLLPFPNFDGALYAGYLLGGDWHDDHDTLYDWSGNGRHLTKVGADSGGFGDMGYFYNANQTHYLVAPFTGIDIAASGAGISLFALHKVDNAVNAALVTNAPPETNGHSTAIQVTTTSGAQAQTISAATTVTASTPADATRGDVWEAAGSVHTLTRTTSYRLLPSSARLQYRNLGTAVTSLAGTRAFRIGNNTVASLSATTPVAAAALYNRALTVAESLEVARTMLVLAETVGLNS